MRGRYKKTTLDLQNIAPPLPLPQSITTTASSPGEHHLAGIEPTQAALTLHVFLTPSLSLDDSFHPEAPQSTTMPLPCSPG